MIENKTIIMCDNGECEPCLKWLANNYPLIKWCTGDSLDYKPSAIFKGQGILYLRGNSLTKDESSEKYNLFINGNIPTRYLDFKVINASDLLYKYPSESMLMDILN